MTFTRRFSGWRSGAALAISLGAVSAFTTGTALADIQELAGNPPNTLQELNVSQAEHLPSATIPEDGAPPNPFEFNDCDSNQNANCENDLPMVCVMRPPLSEVCQEPTGGGFWEFFVPEVFGCSQEAWDLEVTEGFLLGLRFEQTVDVPPGQQGGPTPAQNEDCGFPRAPGIDGVSWGCFPLDAEIVLADGSTRTAEELFKGDQVLNPLTGEAATIESVVESREHEPLIEFGAGASRTRVTQTHPVWTTDGLKQARHLQLSDQIRLADGSLAKLEVLRELPIDQNQRVVNFILSAPGGEDAHYLIADGVVTGDLYLQRKLVQEEQ